MAEIHGAGSEVSQIGRSFGTEAEFGTPSASRTLEFSREGPLLSQIGRSFGTKGEFGTIDGYRTVTTARGSTREPTGVPDRASVGSEGRVWDAGGVGCPTAPCSAGTRRRPLDAWERDGARGSVVGGRPEVDPALVHLDDALHDEEAEPEARVLRCVRALA